MITIQKLKETLHYNPDKGEFRWKSHPRYSYFNGRIAGGLDHRGYRRIGIDGQQYLAHRLAWALAYGKWPSAFLDHINLRRSDNRITNLREVTPSQNLMNRPGCLKGHSSRFKGVTWHKKCRKWQASIKLAGKNHHLGLFASEEDAHAAYSNASRRLHGEFGRSL